MKESTLRSHILMLEKGNEIKPVGQPKILNNQQETELIKWIKDQGNKNQCKSQREIRIQVFKLKNN